MIRISPQPEPTNFDTTVRQRGIRFLSHTPKPTYKDFLAHSYWTAALPDLMSQYQENCAYSGLRLWTKAQEATVDHYLPKVKNPEEAYEWTNFRLCNRSINGWKREHKVVDPLKIGTDWFYLDFNDFEVKVQPHINYKLRMSLERHINILGLNKNQFVNYRSEWFQRIIEGEANMSILTKDAYFIAYEIRRQNIDIP